MKPPKKRFRVLAKETVFYRGIIEADDRDSLDEMDIEDMDLTEYDSESMEISTVEEII